MKTRFIYFILASVVLTYTYSCSTIGRLSKVNLIQYDSSIHIPYQVFNTSDGSELVCILPPGDFKLRLNVYNSFLAKESLYKTEKNITTSDHEEITVRIPIHHANCTLEFSIVELNKEESFSDILVLDRSRDTRQNIRLSFPDGSNLIYSDIKPGQKLKTSHNFDHLNNLYIKYFDKNFPPASPPWTARSLSFNLLNNYKWLKENPADSFFLFEKPGMYYIQTDTLNESGVFVTCFEKDFPELKSVNTLIESLRYITKNEEYQNLITSDDPKLQLDEFWLERASGKDRARVLIRSYYNAIQNANIYFTSYKEGWKTDRGIIYTIFGSPSTINKTPDYEYWFYPEKENREPVGFYFDRSQEQYILRRSPNYKAAWDTEVFEWRQGIIR